MKDLEKLKQIKKTK